MMSLVVALSPYRIHRIHAGYSILEDTSGYTQDTSGYVRIQFEENLPPIFKRTPPLTPE